MLKKENRLKKRKEYKYIFRKGKKLFSESFIMVYVPTKLENYKIGVSISKKVGNAVERNRISRRLKNALRKQNININPKYNYIFVARKNATTKNYKQIYLEIENLLKRLN